MRSQWDRNADASVVKVGFYQDQAVSTVITGPTEAKWLPALSLQYCCLLTDKKATLLRLQTDLMCARVYTQGYTKLLTTRHTSDMPFILFCIHQCKLRLCINTTSGITVSSTCFQRFSDIFFLNNWNKYMHMKRDRLMQCGKSPVKTKHFLHHNSVLLLIHSMSLFASELCCLYSSAPIPHCGCSPSCSSIPLWLLTAE